MFLTKFIVGLTCFFVAVSGELSLADLQYIQSLSEHEIREMLKNNLNTSGSGSGGIHGIVTEQGEFVSNADILDIVPGILANNDGCQPRNTSVKVPLSNDPSVLVIPQCVLVQMCAGCCGHDSLSCQPTNVFYSTKQIYNMVIDSRGQLQVKSIENKQFEEHRSCSCQCKVKQTDCRPDRHIYDQASCSCRCINEAQIRPTCTGNKIWSDSQCACVCRTTDFCALGEYFDPLTCRCEIPSGRTVSATTQSPAALKCQAMPCRAGLSPGLDANGVCVCRATGSWGVQQGSLDGDQPSDVAGQPDDSPSRPRPRPRPRG